MINILVDPIWSDRCSPVSWAGPRRYSRPGLRFEDLPAIDAVLVSHNHYDHLDKPTIERLRENTRVFAPLGLKQYIQKLGKPHVEEMDWWQTADGGNGIQLLCLPAQHWSMRFGQWRNTTLWASFLLSSPDLQIFIGGDSRYFIGFKEIGRNCPEIDYALLPLTAYHPRWFMHQAHMNAVETLDAFRDLKAKVLIPTQWGAFRLGNEPTGYPALDLKRKMKEENIDPARVLILDLGEIVAIPGKAALASPAL